nr:hypothetical protein CFP56_68009 [Quercus suber]
MTSQGLVAPSTVNSEIVAPTLIPLLVRNKHYAVTMVHSLVRDVDLDECSEHEMEPLGDVGLFHLTRELAKTSANLRTKLAALLEQVNKTKVDTVEEFKDSQPYFDKLGGQYGEGFKEFRKQAILIFHEIDDKEDDIQVEVEKAILAGGVIDRQTATEGPTVPEAPPTLLF